MNNYPKIKFFSSSLLLAIFIVTGLGGMFFLPQAAQAQFIVSDPGKQAQDLAFRTIDNFTQGLKTAVLTAAGTAVSTVLKKLTYESAVWLASGGKGQTPFADTKTFTNYLGDVLNDAGGRAIEELGRPGGFNLCKIPDVKTDLALRLGLRLSFNPTPTDLAKQPSCTFTDFQKNWSAESWKSKYGDTFSAGSIEKQFNAALDVDQTGLGIALIGAQKINDQINKAVSGATNERVANQGFNAKLSKVSNQIQIPAQVIGEEFKKNTPGEETKRNQDQIEAAITNGDFKALPKALITFFGNTLAGNVIKNFQEKGVLPFGINCIGSVGGENCAKRADFAGSFEESGVFSSREAAQELFNEYLAVQTDVVDEYNILSQLSTCPDSPNLYNCRADDKLVEAAQSSAAGDSITIQEALSKGLLHPDWQLIPPTRIAENTSKNCYKSNMYCYSNIKVLRQVRLLPIGFEIAALNSDPDKPWTLGEVVKGFNNCEYQNGVLSYDPINHPFCHLIDPNWVLKVSPTRCNAVVFGSTLLNQDVPDRIQECADLSSCVGYNKDGTCISYGYCTREKNTWSINGEKCDAQFRTCRSFTDSTGATKAYVYRSLDTGSCTEKNSGCLAYSLSQDASGKWQAPATPSAANNYINQSVYLNNQVSTSCSTQSVGCSAFKLASAGLNASNNTLLYLRQAPPYLKCYDSNPATPVIEWPKTRADLQRLQADPQCAEYAGVCIPDEVSCNWYTPALGGGIRVPGRFEPAAVENNQIVWNDQCDASCVGYASFRELPSNYSVGQNLAYIIPKSGRTCQASEEGCSSFTNLSTTNNGVESTEYFSYLRTCALPNASNDKNFITYEGATVGGYQIKTFTLVKDSTGGPRYWYRTPADLQQYETICTESLYKQGLADPDCRQFNDDQGQIYYRLLSKVIPVSESCTPYRLNTTELLSASALDQTACQQQKGLWSNNSCSLCLQGGEYKDGSCFYYGLPESVNNAAGNSRTCRAEADTCRAYKGNTGNNIRQIVSENFEGSNPVQVLSGWGPIGQVSVSGESTHVGEHSLGYDGSGTVTKDVQLVPGKTYDLTFWAKGSGQSVTVSLNSADGSFAKDFATISLGDTWNLYHLGPVEAKGTTVSMLLAFKNASAAKLYLDNVRLVEITDYTFLVKKSLSVSNLCDSDSTDNLPGEALGCSEYKDPANKSFYLSNFSYLCREGAIGCSAVFDTKNTPADAGPRAYNIWLSGAGGTTAQAKLSDAVSDTFSCQIPVGGSGCYVNIFGHEVGKIINAVGAGAIVKSTTIIPSDTPADAPIYLVANEASSCNVADLGCVYAGKSVASPLGPAFVTTTIKNDPALYENTLCQSEAVGCTTYGDSNGGQVYFKDPSLIEQKICTYKNDVVINGAKVGGWFWKNVGVCSDKKDQKCQQDTDCNSGATCINIGTQPCYPDYFQEGGTYGLWSYGDTGKYNNFVGECPVEQDRCTEFVDRNDNNKAYYYKKNEKITAGDCDGQVSQREGCALFDQTDNPNHFFLTQESYKASENNNFQKVKPVVASDPGNNDANIIIKVERDRECGEWLQCRSSHRVWDVKNSRWKNVCDSIGRCNKVPETSSENNLTNCASWVESDLENNDFSGVALTPQNYIDRDISWSGQDFAGYSILGLVPIEEVSQVNISTNPEKPDWRLVKTIPCGGINCAIGVDPGSTACTSKPEDTTCGKDRSGTCVNKLCIKNLDNTSLSNNKINTTEFYSNKIPTQSCRAYPEKDSPFPNLTEVSGKNSSNNFQKVNLCNEIKGPTTNAAAAYACECDYVKASYGDLQTVYWNYNSPNKLDPAPGSKSPGEKLPDGLCVGGGIDKEGKPVDGKACLVDDDCVGVSKNAGTCSRLKKESKLLGWRGFCLESDLSRSINGNGNAHPCLSWLPIDFLAGTVDVNNIYPEAGYTPPSVGGKYYCIEASSSGGAGTGDKTWPQYTYPYNHYVVVRGKKGQSDSTLFFGSNKNYNAELYGKASGEEFSRGRFDFTTDNEVLVSAIANSNEQLTTPIKKQDIEQVIFTVKNGDGEDPKNGTTAMLWPNAPMTSGGNGFQAEYTVDTNGANTPGRIVTGRYFGRPNEFILFYGSRQFDDQESTYVDSAGNILDVQGLQGNIFAKNGSLQVGDVNLPEGIWDQTALPDFNTKVCQSRKSDGNWHAIRLVFKPNGDFSHYDTAYCDVSNDDGEVKYEVVFKLRQWCRVVADVGYDPLSASANRAIAATNNLWSGSNFVLSGGQNEFGRAIVFDRNLPVSAFGSLLAEEFNLSQREPLVMSNFAYRDGANDCGSSTNKTCRFAPAVVIPGKRDPGVLFESEFGPKNNTAYEKPSLASGSSFGCSFRNGGCVSVAVNGEETNNSSASYLSGNEGSQVLESLFPRVKGYAVFDLDRSAYFPSREQELKDMDSTELGISGRRPNSPLVFPIQDEACLADDQCVEDSSEPGITINDKSRSSVRYFTPTAKTTLKFFAFADSNQMPLRNIKVDWGDGTTVFESSGLYRNERGLQEAVCNKKTNTCQTTELLDESCPCSTPGAVCNPAIGRCVLTRSDVGAQSCVADSDCKPSSTCYDAAGAKNFGFGHIQDQTCHNGYFQFDHTYRCTTNSPSFRQTADCPGGVSGRNSAYPNGCCMFRPKVQVKDNWGWCNGTCRLKDFDYLGCYDGKGKNECQQPEAWTAFGTAKTPSYVVLPPAK